MEMSVQQVCAQLLDRKVWRGHNMDYWLEQILPQGIEQMEAHYEQASKEHRSELAQILRYRDLNAPLGSSEFEVAYQKAKKAMELPSDDQSKIDCEKTCSYRAKFHAIRDLGIRMREDILPKLRSLRDGEGCNTLTALQVRDILNTCGELSLRLKVDLPEVLQPDQPQETYNLFADDMKQLLNCADANERRLAKRGVISCGEHTEAARNRLEGYWRSK